MIWTLKIIGIKIADEYYPLKKEDKMLKNIISAVFFTAIIATSMPTIAAVSYTHLDVYKRQFYSWRIVCSI